MMSESPKYKLEIYTTDNFNTPYRWIIIQTKPRAIISDGYEETLDGAIQSGRNMYQQLARSNIVD